MEDIDGGLHPAVDGQSLDEDEDEDDDGGESDGYCDNVLNNNGGTAVSTAVHY